METIERSGSLNGRAGGLILTARAVEIGGFGKSSRVLDIGCSSGETVRYLRSEYGIEASGIDKNLDQSLGEPYLIMGHAEDMPFPRLEITPPVTNIYFVIFSILLRLCIRRQC